MMMTLMVMMMMMMGIIIMILESAALPNGSKVVAVSRWKYGYTEVWKHKSNIFRSAYN